MKKPFTLPTWQVFLIFLIPCLIPPISYLAIILLDAWGILVAYCIYQLANSLYNKLPEGSGLNIKRFNFQLAFPLVYIVLITVIFKGGYEINQSNSSEYGWWLLIIIPAHLYAMFCIFYTIWFIAKAVATIEYKKPVGLDLYLGNFFLLWFFPIGIWWIHPKIRRIFSEGIENTGPINS